MRKPTERSLAIIRAIKAVWYPGIRSPEIAVRIKDHGLNMTAEQVRHYFKQYKTTLLLGYRLPALSEKTRSEIAKQRIHEIMQAWKPGDSAAMLAQKLHMTRNAVIGVYYRNPDELMHHPLGGAPKRRKPRISPTDHKRTRRPKKQKKKGWERPADVATKTVPFDLGRIHVKNNNFIEELKITPPRKETEKIDGFKSLSIFELDNKTCRFPHGSGKNITFCGQKPLGEHPYCETHCNIAYRNPDERR